MGWEAVHADQALVSATKVWGPRMVRDAQRRSQRGTSGCFENGIVSLIPLVYCTLGNGGLPCKSRDFWLGPSESQAIKMDLLAMLAKNMFGLRTYQLYVRLGDPQKHWLGMLRAGPFMSQPLPHSWSPILKIQQQHNRINFTMVYQCTRLR